MVFQNINENPKELTSTRRVQNNNKNRSFWRKQTRKYNNLKITSTFANMKLSEIANTNTKNFITITGPKAELRNLMKNFNQEYSSLYNIPNAPHITLQDVVEKYAEKPSCSDFTENDLISNSFGSMIGVM